MLQQLFRIFKFEISEVNVEYDYVFIVYLF